MYKDDDLIYKIFISINNSVNIVLQRFHKIHTASDFVKNEKGLETLDSISMRLQFIGESLKKIEKLDKYFFSRYTEIEWNKIMNLRDFISHHYDMLNHEIIFDICENHIPKLHEQIDAIINEIGNN